MIEELGKSIKGVLFDFDGVLGDTLNDNYRAWNAAMARHGKSIEREEYFVLEGHTIREVAQIFAESHGIAAEQIDQIWKDKEQYYRENATARLYPRAIALVSLLKKRGLRLALVTAATRKRLSDQLLGELLSLMDGAVSGDDVQHGKPAPDPYLKGAEKLGLAPAECLVVENAPMGIRSARAAGIRCVGICSSLSREHLKLADEIFDNLDDLYEAILQRKKPLPVG